MSVSLEKVNFFHLCCAGMKTKNQKERISLRYGSALTYMHLDLVLYLFMPSHVDVLKFSYIFYFQKVYILPSLKLLPHLHDNAFYVMNADLYFL